LCSLFIFITFITLAVDVLLSVAGRWENSVNVMQNMVLTFVIFALSTFLFKCSLILSLMTMLICEYPDNVPFVLSFNFSVLISLDFWYGFIHHLLGLW